MAFVLDHRAVLCCCCLSNAKSAVETLTVCVGVKGNRILEKVMMILYWLIIWNEWTMNLLWGSREHQFISNMYFLEYFYVWTILF